MTMFDTVLIANRGEIACRVIRSCRRLGLRSVAVYSDADAGARHVREADAAVRIGPPPARQSYLDAAALVEAARRHGAQAVHPGYGFLSEKLELVDACAAAGLVFVGPHRDAIARMGSKIESKRIARAAGVACVPGYDGDDQDDARLADEATRIGFPLLIKASAGGGGKGMKRVDHAAEFLPRLAEARAEAQAAFGDDRVLLERCLLRPRHLEVQLLGDRHGGLVHLFERECSIQRHYQKLIEEAPAPHLSEPQRQQLYNAALALGRAIGYDSAGTVEFVLDDSAGGQPYFLEMNTRLQVEHPVTELTTGLDLVELQLRSAAGEPLPFTQDQVRRRGWAIEARVNAGVPAEDFRAAFGPVTHYDEPQGEGLRVDSGIDAHSEVSPHYDALLVKLIGHGASRAVAVERLRQGLRGLHVGGLQTNQPLLDAVLGHPGFAAPLHTGFLAEAFPGGWRPAAPLIDEQVAAAAAAAWLIAALGATASDRPFDTLTGFRVGGRSRSVIEVGIAGAAAGTAPQALAVVCLGPRRVQVDAGGRHHVFDAEAVAADRATLACGTRRYQARQDAQGLALWCDGDGRHWQVRTPLQAATARGEAATANGGDAISAELPGLVHSLLVQPGQPVRAGQPVAVIEAMKLLHTLAAPRDGVIAALPVAVGVTVQRGAVLATLATQAP